MDRVQAHRTDIQKLAEKDKIKGALKAIQDREPIDGGFTPFETGSFAPNSNASAGTDGGIDPDDPNSFAEPDPSDPNNQNNKGGTNNRDPHKDGPQDADDLLDDTKGPVFPDDSKSDPYSGGSLTKITGLQDCDTGQCVTAHLDGKFDAPSGWDDPDTPPPIAGWFLGYNWNNTTHPTIFFLTSIESMNDFVAALLLDSFYTSVTNIRLDSQTSTTDKYLYDYTTTLGGSFIYTASNTQSKNTCTPSANDASCPIDPPTKTEWPQDGCYDVAMIDGQLQTNQYDSEAPASAKEMRSAAIFCTSKGKKTMIRAAANGGTMLYEVTASGAPTGIVKVYNSDGTLRSAGDASQQNIDSQLPK